MAAAATKALEPADGEAERGDADASGVQPPTHRNILIFSDGTGNSSAKVFRTNVWKLYRAVDLEDPQHRPWPRQYAFYDNGVGTSTFRPIALLGGAFGIGLGRNVRELYAFVCRTYRPGDKIYAFGFSRGAFTARVVVGLLMNQGVVAYRGDEGELDRNVAAAYRAYRRRYKLAGRREAAQAQPRSSKPQAAREKESGGLVEWIRDARDAVIRWRNTLFGYTQYEDVERYGAPDSEKKLEVEFLGVWDTVAAYGLPVDELTRAVDRWFWPLSMPDRDLSTRVRRAMHALSLDDERHTFHPQLWNEAAPPPKPGQVVEAGPPNGTEPADHVDKERLSQVWFAGAHADVGGGYADDSLSYVALKWIREGAEKAGVRFVPRILADYEALSDENGPVHNPREGLGGFYRYNPRRIEHLTRTPAVKIDRVKIHESVLRRIRVGQDGYAPLVIPPRFDVVRIDGRIESERSYFHNNPVPGGTVYRRRDYANAREHAFNLVWFRRILYFVTLFVALTLALVPTIWPAAEDGACQGRLCFVAELLDPVAAVVPAAFGPWLESFSSHPGTILIIVALLWAGTRLGGNLEAHTRNAMRRVWYSLPATTPGGSFYPPIVLGSFGRRLCMFRKHRRYRKFHRWFANRLLPAVFIAAVLYLAAALIAQTIFNVRSSWGGICESAEGSAQTVEARTGPLHVTTSALCTATRLRLEEGATYRVTLSVPATDPWIDEPPVIGPGVRAGVHGVEPRDVTLLMTAGVPLRRHLTWPWFKPFVRIGSLGSDAYPLEPRPSALPLKVEPGQAPPGCPAEIALSSEIVARTSGELFFYVNDAIALPPFTDAFYANNKGTACLTVERLRPRP